MNCEEAQKLISRRIDGELEEAQAPMLEAHIAACPACSAYHADLEALRRFFRSVETPAPSEDLWERVRGAAKPELKRRMLQRIQDYTIRLAAAALVVAAFTLALFLIDSKDPIQAKDRKGEIHYEDLFQQSASRDPELIEALIRTTDPEGALRFRSAEGRP